MGGQSSPVLAGDILYFGSDDGHLYALDKQTGKLLWKFYFGCPIKGSPIVSGNALYLSDYDGNLFAFTGL